MQYSEPRRLFLLTFECSNIDQGYVGFLLLLNSFAAIPADITPLLVSQSCSGSGPEKARRVVEDPRLVFTFQTGAVVPDRSN